MWYTSHTMSRETLDNSFVLQAQVREFFRDYYFGPRYGLNKSYDQRGPRRFAEFVLGISRKDQLLAVRTACLEMLIATTVRGFSPPSLCNVSLSDISASSKGCDITVADPYRRIIGGFAVASSAKSSERRQQAASQRNIGFPVAPLLLNPDQWGVGVLLDTLRGSDIPTLDQLVAAQLEEGTIANGVKALHRQLPIPDQSPFSTYIKALKGNIAHYLSPC